MQNKVLKKQLKQNEVNTIVKYHSDNLRRKCWMAEPTFHYDTKYINQAMHQCRTTQQEHLSLTLYKPREH